MASSVDAIQAIESRVGGDLRTLFPDATVDLKWRSEYLECQVDSRQFGLGSTELWVSDEDEDLSDEDVENLIYRVAEQIAENLWPDEYDDPWPLCPNHDPHPMSPALFRGRAAWLCYQDRRTSIDIGSLRART